MLCSPQGQVPKNLSRVKYKTENAMPGIKKKKNHDGYLKMQ